MSSRINPCCSLLYTRNEAATQRSNRSSMKTVYLINCYSVSDIGKYQYTASAYSIQAVWKLDGEKHSFLFRSSNTHYNIKYSRGFIYILPCLIRSSSILTVLLILASYLEHCFKRFSTDTFYRLPNRFLHKRQRCYLHRKYNWRGRD